MTPIGGQRDIDVDVRVIATTNRNMMDEVKEKSLEKTFIIDSMFSH